MTLKKLLAVLGAIALFIVVLIGSVLGFAGYANYASERAASAFCGNTPIGSDVKLAISRAAQQGIRYRGPLVTNAKEEHRFEIQGWVFNVGLCRVEVANGKVTSLHVEMDGD